MDASFKSTIHWALIGLGRSGKAHLRQLERLSSDFRVIACCDVNSAQLPNGKYTTFTRWEELSANWASLGLQGASVCTPINHHAKLVESIINLKGKVLCEKPLSICREEIKRLTDLNQNESLFMVAQLLFEPSFSFLRWVKATENIGRLRKIHYNLHLWETRQPDDLVASFSPHYIQHALILGGRSSDPYVHYYASRQTIIIQLSHINGIETCIELSAACECTLLRMTLNFDLGEIIIENGLLIDFPESCRNIAEKVNAQWFQGIANYPVGTHFGPGLRNQYLNLVRVIRQEIPARPLMDGIDASRMVVKILGSI